MTETDIKHLYKYRSIADPTKKHVEQIFLSDEIYLPKPNEFNDPFDCIPVPSLEATKTECKVYLDELYRRQNPQGSRKSRMIWIDKIMKDKFANHRLKYTTAELVKIIEEIPNMAGLYSLSAKNDHVLMWSHYADSHRGICLIFNASTEYFGRAHKVTYQENRPIFNLIKDTHEEILNKILLVKADYWAYEEEYRIIGHKEGPGRHKFPPYLLEGVIFGAKTSNLDRDLVLEWQSKRNIPITFYQATISKDKFKLNIMAI
jgi:hypothetical protein